jgi:hypothetical protein
MRITRQVLNKIAQDTVAQRARSDRDVLSAYLHGSLLENNPLLGGATDIDLVFVHNDGVIVPREIKRLTDEVHLDIAHHDRSEYRRTRELRVHPWRGPTIFRCKILHDPQHFMDFTQASVRGQYNRPENVLARSQGQAEHARQMWFELEALQGEPELENVRTYLRAVEHATNAAASLSGPPLTERRFLLRLPARAEAIRRPGLYPATLGLLGAPNVDGETLKAWLPGWERAYRATPAGSTQARLHPDRYTYYRRAFEVILSGDSPHDLLWPLVRTWVDAIAHLPEQEPERDVWVDCFEKLGLYGAGFGQRIAALDAYLDMVEEILEAWARANGAEYRVRGF